VGGVLPGPTRAGAPTPSPVRQRLEATFGARPRTPRRILVATACTAALALVWWSARPRGAAVEEIRGALDLTRGGATVAASAGDALAVADLVRARNGSARLRLDGEATVVLDEGGALSIGQRPAAASLLRGRAAFDVVPGHGPFRVTTPAGEVSVTGTAFEIDVVPPGTEGMTMKRTTLARAGVAAAGVAGALALVHVTRGSVIVGSGGRTVALSAGQSATMVSDRPPELTATLPRLSLADRLEQQNASLREEVVRLRAEVAHRQAQAAALPAAGAVDTPRETWAPLTTDERKLLGAANVKVSLETRRKLADLYREVRGKDAPDGMSELELARDLLRELRVAHISILSALPKGGDVGQMIAAGLPPTVAQALRLLQERNGRVQEELARTLPQRRAAAVASTIASKTHVGFADDAEFADVSLGVPPGPGQPLTPPEDLERR
jgi:hypothetical protein